MATDVAPPLGFVVDPPPPDGFVLDGAPTPVQKFNARTWSDVPLDAIKNAPGSAMNFAKGIYQAVRHPIDTAGNVADLAAGGLQNAVRAVSPGAVDFINNIAPSDANQRTADTANAVGQFYKDRYGSAEGLKNTLATDPVGAAADLSTVLAGGAVLAPAKAAGVLSTASKYMNPLGAIGPAIKTVENVAAIPAKPIVGMLTGVGSENLTQAFNSGLKGKTAFWDNLTGNVPMTDVLDAAKKNIEQMGIDKSKVYRSGMVDIKADKSILNFDGINNALKDAYGMVTFKGQPKNAQGVNVVDEIAKTVDEWKALDPAQYHTPEGLDALKQRIGGIVEQIPNEQKTARMVGKKVYDSVKNEIQGQAPTYAKVMKEYADSTDQIKEIERALSLGDKASIDTGLRKLQSLSRNNVNTNYGNRLALAKTLESQGGNELMPSIAGQAMSSITPRGLAGHASGLATLIGAYAHNPLMLSLLPMQSPAAVGAGLYGAGRGIGLANGLLSQSPISAQQLNTGGLLLNQAGRLPQN